MKDLTPTDSLAEYVPQESEVLLAQAKTQGSFLIIPLSRTILSATPYMKTKRSVDALLLKQARIRGPHGGRFYEFFGLINLEANQALLEAFGCAMLHPPHEEALPEIRRILGKLLGDMFLDRTLTLREKEIDLREGLQRMMAPRRVRPVQPIRGMPKIITRP